MSEQTSAQHGTTGVSIVELTPADAPAARELLNRWLVAIDASNSDRKEAFRSQANGILDGIKLVENQRFKYQTHIGKLQGEHQPHPIFFKYHVPVVSVADRRPEADATATLAGIVKDPATTGSVPKPVMLAVHTYVASQATNRTVKLQADAQRLIAYYAEFGYRVNAGEEKSDKPYMSATLDEMSVSEASKVQ